MSSWRKSRLKPAVLEGSQTQGLRAIQEDYFEVNPERGIYLLADGFGGSAGYEAAELVVKAVRRYLEQEAGDLDATMPFELRPYFSLAGNVLFNAIQFANQKLLKHNEGRTPFNSGGASLLAAYLEGNLLSIANVGVNKLVLKRGSQVKDLVRPKSLLGQSDPMRDEGPGDDVPLMSFGTAKSLEPEIVEIELRAGDELLFETSGLGLQLRERILSLDDPSGLGQMLKAADTASNASAIYLRF